MESDQESLLREKSDRRFWKIAEWIYFLAILAVASSWSACLFATDGI